MSAQNGHVAEAVRLATMADQTYGQIEIMNGDQAVSQQIEAQTLAVAAQAHATLALVEQQRIANLIAFADLAERQYQATDSYPDLYDRSTLHDSVDRHNSALRQVREGLGLS